jgi:hypothetical protein
MVSPPSVSAGSFDHTDANGMRRGEERSATVGSARIACIRHGKGTAAGFPYVTDGPTCTTQIGVAA